MSSRDWASRFASARWSGVGGGFRAFASLQLKERAVRTVGRDNEPKAFPASSRAMPRRLLADPLRAQQRDGGGQNMVAMFMALCLSQPQFDLTFEFFGLVLDVAQFFS